MTKKDDKYFKVSKYWLDIDKYQSDPNLLKLVSIQKIISNFVKIINKKDIPAHFSEKTGASFTDSKEIIISAEPQKLDKVIGISIHEASHIKKSDFKVYDDPNANSYFELIKRYSKNQVFNEELFELKNYIHHFYNLFEDFRIDTETINENPGYKGYVDIRYQDYFEDEEIKKLIKSKSFRDETWQSYKFRVTNIINSEFDLKVLKGLQEISDKIDIGNISRLKNSLDTLNLAVDVFKIIEKYCDEIKEVKKTQSSSNNQKNKEIIIQQENNINHRIIKKKVNKQTAKSIEGILHTNINIKEISFDPTIPEEKVIIINHITDQFIENDPFNLFHKNKNLKHKELIIAQGKNIGERLASKLQIRNIERNEICSFKQRGKIDKRKLFSASYDDHIFYQEIKNQSNDIYIRFSIDGSGSMLGSKWFLTIKTVLAICYACLKIKGIRTVVDFRITSNIDGEDHPIILTVFDSSYERIEKLIKIIKVFEPMFGTPEGLCFASILNEIEGKNQNKDSFFINFSDGMPMYKHYGGQLALDHTKKMILKIKQKGIKVLSYFIYNYLDQSIKQNFIQMYGKDAHFCNLDELNSLARSLNKFFTKGY